MNLLIKELRECIPISFIYLSVIIFTVLFSGVLSIRSGLINSSVFYSASFIITMGISATLGAVTIGHDRQHGSISFLDSLPIERTRLYIYKTFITLFITVLFTISLYTWLPITGNTQFWSLILLSYGLGNFLGLSFPSVAMAGTLGFSISMIGFPLVQLIEQNYIDCGMDLRFLLNMIIITGTILILVSSFLLEYNKIVPR